MNKDSKRDKNYYSGPMENQSTVGDTDGNNSDVIMYDAGITIDSDLENKCDDDAKDTQTEPNK